MHHRITSYNVCYTKLLRHGREAEHQQWKAGVLAGDIVLEDIDTTPYNFAARGKPSLPSSREARNMVAGAVGRPGAESVGNR